MPDRRPFHVLVITLMLVATAASGPAGAAVKRMFVTSASGNGDLSTWPQAGNSAGRAAGDKTCQNLAASAGLSNASGFRAWLSTDATDAFCHVAGFSGKRASNCGQASLPNAGPWVRMDGKPFAHKLQSLTSTTRIIFYPAMIAETGSPVPPSYVHTGTWEDGTTARPGGVAADCSDWTSSSLMEDHQIGETHGGSIWWNQASSIDCASDGRLLCFETGLGDDLPSFGRPGAFVFVSSALGTGNLGSWSEAQGHTGLAAGDAICQTLAAAAGYVAPASFRAWLSAGSTAAIDRLTIDGPFRRPGGVEIGATKDWLVSGTPSDAALAADIEVDDLGIHNAYQAFTGTTAPGQPSGFDCNGWTSASAGDVATFGFGNVATGSWTEAGTRSCDKISHIYCFTNVVGLFADGFESGNTSAWAAKAP
ncbi:MAG TPA: hypothetical protein VGV61_05830 [Thermoanaerobaculia bacterium]|jgi:hypothetical protein|nr:hypothetical protein [Thermoanaerobaculia bacterium]